MSKDQHIQAIILHKDNRRLQREMWRVRERSLRRKGKWRLTLLSYEARGGPSKAGSAI